MNRKPQVGLLTWRGGETAFFLGYPDKDVLSPVPANCPQSYSLPPADTGDIPANSSATPAALNNFPAGNSFVPTHPANTPADSTPSAAIFPPVPLAFLLVPQTWRPVPRTFPRVPLARQPFPQPICESRRHETGSRRAFYTKTGLLPSGAGQKSQPVGLAFSRAAVFPCPLNLKHNNTTPQ